MIAKSDTYDEVMVKRMLQVTTEEHEAKWKARELGEEKERLEKEQKYELEKLQLQLECQCLSSVEAAQYSPETSQDNN